MEDGSFAWVNNVWWCEWLRYEKNELTITAKGRGKMSYQNFEKQLLNSRGVIQNYFINKKK